MNIRDLKEILEHVPDHLECHVSIYNVLDDLGEPRVIHTELDNLEYEGHIVYFNGSLPGEF